MWLPTMNTETMDDDLIIYSPLMRSFTFNAWLVAGYTPIFPGNRLDTFIQRERGMKGYIINITLRGAGVIHRNKETFICRPNDVVLFPPGCPHHYGREAKSDCWEHLWIYFMPRPYWIDWLKWDRQWHDVGITRSSDDDFIQRLKSDFKEVIRLYSSTDRLDAILAVNCLEKILLHCFKLQPGSNCLSLDPRIIAICQYLDEHLEEKITINTLAARAFLSPSRLAHLFRQETGMTIFAWREKQRMNRASLLLQHAQLTIAHIAQLVGYDDALYFSRLFNQQFGVGPREYRKRFSQLNTL
jgi:AraC family transcriptional regulator of arabinose operon